MDIKQIKQKYINKIDRSEIWDVDKELYLNWKSSLKLVERLEEIENILDDEYECKIERIREAIDR
jgi:hypothetical protein